MLTRYRHATAAAAALLTLTSLSVVPLSVAADPEPPAAEVHETTIDSQVEIAQSMADHEGVAQRFDEEAAEFDQKAAEHERLAKYYRRGLGAGPKGDPASLAIHCERIGKNLRQSAADAREMARMHRDVAHKVVK